MNTKPRSQQYQGLALPDKAIIPASPCKVGLGQILCNILHFYFAKKQAIRKTRKDKTHNIKFPVDPITQIKLKSFAKEAKGMNELRGKEGITKTKLNTALLRFGIEHLELINWSQSYKDTKVYMHTNCLQTEYVSWCCYSFVNIGLEDSSMYNTISLDALWV